MKKIFTFIAAMLVAFAVNADTDFAAPGYPCAADDAVLANVYGLSLNTASEPHYIECAEATYNVVLATWTVSATRGCYVSVSLDLGQAYGSNKHIFEVTIKDNHGNTKGTVIESAESTAADQVKALDGTILLPTEGVYTVELVSRRQFGKGTIKNIILTYAADAPSEIIEVTSVNLNKTELSLDVDEVELLAATVLPDDATDPSVTWESSAPAVATVSDGGFVTAISAGTATITARAGEQSATCAVTVSVPSIPDVDFASPYYLSGKKAHLEGAVWKNGDYKLYGDGGHNKKYGNAYWTIHVTRPCTVLGMLNGVEGGHLFELDLFHGEDSITTITQKEGSTWWSGDISMDGYFSFDAAGDYTLRLRNTQEWSSGKVAGITLTYNVIYPEGSVIYFDATAYGQGMNIYLVGAASSSVEFEGDNYFANTNSVIKFTTTSAVNMTTWSNLFKSAGSGWNDVPMQVPADNSYNVIKVNAAGNAFTWSKTPKLAGSFFSGETWAEGAQVMEYAVDYKTCSYSVALEPGQYEFKVIDGDAWYGFNNDADEFTRTNCSNWILYTGTENTILNADVAGNYLFTYTPATNKLTVAYPESFTREAATVNYQTLCVPFDATISNATVYDLGAVEGNSVTLTEHDGNLVAGKSYIIKPVEVADMVITKVPEGTSVAAALNPELEATALYGTLTEIVYNHATDPNPGWTIYVLYEGAFHLLSGDATSTIAPTKAYLHVLVSGGEAPSAIRIVENATGIQNLEGNETAVKFIENGKLFIRKNGVVYDATGAVVR